MSRKTCLCLYLPSPSFLSSLFYTHTKQTFSTRSHPAPLKLSAYILLPTDSSTGCLLGTSNVQNWAQYSCPTLLPQYFPIPVNGDSILLLRPKTLASSLTLLLALIHHIHSITNPVSLFLKVCPEPSVSSHLYYHNLIHITVISHSQLVFLLPSLAINLNISPLQQCVLFILYATICLTLLHIMLSERSQKQEFILYDYFHLKYKNRLNAIRSQGGDGGGDRELFVTEREHHEGWPFLFLIWVMFAYRCLSWLKFSELYTYDMLFSVCILHLHKKF